MGTCTSSPAIAQERKRVQMRAFRHVTGRLRITPAEVSIFIWITNVFIFFFYLKYLPLRR